MRAPLAAALLATVALVASCGDDGGSETTAGEVADDAPATSEAQGPDWSYTGDTGPEFWGELNPEYARCSAGTEQSPIDLAGATPETVPPIEYEYRSSGGTEENNGYEIAVELDDAGSIETLGESYELVGYHFHSPSEHTVDGEAFPAELHLVHSTKDDRLAVIGVLIEEGDENEPLAETLSEVPPAPGDAHELEGEVDATRLLPAGGAGDVYRYDGSLTTPPCTEGVLWTVFADPIEVSPDQLEALTAAYDDDARPVQPRNGRELTIGPLG